ncbi:MAG: hypothetical protein V4602_17085 [Pseudomonadota bacterium]
MTVSDEILEDGSDGFSGSFIRPNWRFRGILFDERSGIGELVRR